MVKENNKKIAKWDTPEYRKKMLEKSKAMWGNPEFRKKMLEQRKRKVLSLARTHHSIFVKCPCVLCGKTIGYVKLSKGDTLKTGFKVYCNTCSNKTIDEWGQ